MNYRHAYHAGNFADVHKHVALAAVLLHLRKKEKPFVVIDTHAGTGRYDLSATEAIRTREAASGIGKLQSLATHNIVLKTYLEIVRSSGPKIYPGSPIITLEMLRPHDRLVAIEKHPEEFAALAAALNPDARARAIEADGYQRLPALLPPPERRGLILLDPPYESADEFERLADAFARAYRRFATGIYILWFPLKVQPKIEALAGELRGAGAAKLLLLTIDIGASASSDAQGWLTASGLLVANPPYGFDLEMREAVSEILPLLRRGKSAESCVEWLIAGR